jgi:hypothetical protein
MPSIIRETSVPANSSNPNLFDGSTFELARQRSVLSFGTSQAATGNFHTLNVGSDVVVEEFIPPILTRYPIIPDEFYAQDVAEAGDRIVLSVRNSTGGALVNRAVVIITGV